MNTVVQTWNIDDIGRVDVAVSDRARYARITVRRDGAVKLILARGMSLSQGRKFLESGRDWIARHLRRVSAEQAGPTLDRDQARHRLIERLEELARKHGFTYNRVFIRDQKTRWGSCSSANNINLNVNLVRLPEDLRDYVLLHELVHTEHKNHGPTFWRALDRLVGDGKRLQRQLRQYQLQR